MSVSFHVRYRWLLGLVGVLFAGCEGGSSIASRTQVDDWRDEIIYEILVDRFDNGDPSNDVIDGIGPDANDLSRFQGGDWRGIVARLPYLERLGVTCLWLSPPYRNVERTASEDGYHGYWPIDFVAANPRFGDLEDLRILVDEAHARGMCVILDVVLNHTGRVFNYDLNANGVVEPGEIEPPYRADGPYEAPLLWLEQPTLFTRQGTTRRTMTLQESHFHRRGAGNLSDPIEREWGDFPTGLRDLATEREDVLEALVESHLYWVEEVDVDGFRLDAVPHAETAFWRAFGQRLRRRLVDIGKERFLLLGEVFNANPAILASYSGLHGLDSAFAFDLKWELIDRVLLDGRPPIGAAGALAEYRSFFAASGQPGGIGISPWQARVTFADNHDVWRIRAELDDPLATQLALIVVFTVDGIPMVYYGTEQDFDGTTHHLSRERMWDSGFAEDGPTFRFLQRLIALRRRSVALRRGNLTIRYLSEFGGDSSASDAAFLAYERQAEDERMLITINAHAFQSSEAEFRTGFAPGTVLRDALNRTDEVWTIDDAGQLQVRLPPRSAVLLEPR